MSDLILSTFRSPFGFGPQAVRRLAPGATLLEMARDMDLPREWWDHGGLIDIDGHVVPRASWGLIRPKPGVTEVRFLLPIHGGGGDDGKNALATVASLALLVGTGFIAGGGLETAFGAAFAANQVGANLAAGALGLLGNAAISSAFAPGGGGGGAQRAAASAGFQGNTLSPGGALPRVLGTRRISPPLACEPLVYFDGDDVLAEAVYVLSGPHKLEDIRLSGVSDDAINDIDLQVVEGFRGGGTQTLVTRHSKSDQVSQELRGQALEDDQQGVDQGADGGWRPRPFSVAGRASPDEIWLALSFPQGLTYNGSAENDVRVPFRLRIRALGGAWRYLPELHFVDGSESQIQATIRLIWDSPASFVPPLVGAGWKTAFVEVPGQSVTPTGATWQADAVFDDGAGSDHLNVATAASSRVTAVELANREARIYLDPAEFAPGFYEVEITRGCAVRDDDFTASSYVLVDGNDGRNVVTYEVYDLFGAWERSGTLSVPARQKLYRATSAVVRVSSVWNDNPVQSDRCAVIAARVRNRQVGQLSVQASGYVKNPWGADPDAWVTTANPAPHFRDALVGDQNGDPVPASLVDDADLEDWHDDCDTLGYEINAEIAGGSVRDVLTRIAQAGFALPRTSETFGVIRGRDTSAEAPRMLFTPRNSRGLTISKSLPRDRVSGLRATFPEAAQDYLPREIIWPATADLARLRAVEYPDLVTEADVLRQIAFDLGEREQRQTVYSFTVPASHIAVRRGDLVELQHDVIDSYAGAAQVVDWTENGSGELTSITVDADLPLVFEDDVRSVADIRAVEDFRALGLTSHFVLRGDDAVRGTGALSGTTGDSNVLTLATPLAAHGIYTGAWVAVGPGERVSRRLIVADIRRSGRFEAEITGLDEAPALFANH